MFAIYVHRGLALLGISKVIIRELQQFNRVFSGVLYYIIIGMEQMVVIIGKPWINTDVLSSSGDGLRVCLLR